MKSGFLSEFREMRRFQKLDRAERKIVFYAESESYWEYLAPFIRRLIENHGESICYLTSSPKDPVLKGDIPGVRPFYIGGGSVRTMLFASLDADVMVMTLPELGKHHLKKSKYPVHYVFVPHNMFSTHMVFKKGAYDAFDTVFCAGPHHFDELSEAEELYGLTAKRLPKIGYVRLDALYQEAKRRGPPPPFPRRRVLITPSWPPYSLLETVGTDLIRLLLSAHYTVFVRPHRDTQRVYLETLKKHFGDKENFILAEGKQGQDAFFESDLLITDWSGSAFSFAFTRELPVLFIDIPRKVLNPEYKRFRNPPLETVIREEIGAVLKPERVYDAPRLCELLCDRREERAERIRTQRDRWVYNFGNSAQIGADYLAQLV